MRKSLRFMVKGALREVGDFSPDEMLLDYLRLREGLTGTKEGCAEGDCGACTVALGRPAGETMVYRPVNACIQLLGAVDGADVVTVQDLADGGTLHPVQAAMVEHHGSQCGFCTPGIVMSLFSLFHGPVEADRNAVGDWLAGNLCRCTGYRPIVDAGIAACAGSRQDRFTARERKTAAVLREFQGREDIFVGGKESFFAAPVTLASLALLYDRNPDAVLVAGGTDVGLWITKQLRDIRKIIYLGRVQGLDRIEDVGKAILIGAAASFSAVEPYLAAIDPDLGELFRRLGGKQVRAVGTMGGNIANGSPIGDSPPALIALGASIELRKGPESRTMPLENFFVDYGKQNREPGEFLTGIMVPKLGAGELFRCFKVSKRFDQDISSVMGAFRFRVSDGVIREARIAYGGMAATPRRASKAEAALYGTPVNSSTSWAKAFAALREDFQPIDDHRASARYRAETAQALLGKALIEAAGTGSGRTRLVGHREALDATA